MDEDNRRIMRGEQPAPADDSENAVNDTPPQLREWVERNADRIRRAEKRGALPHFLRDNREAAGLDTRQSAAKPRKTPQQAAAERHARRTPEEERRLREYWQAKHAEGIRARADARHAARTQEQAEDIKTRYWEKRLPANYTDEERKAIARNILDMEKATGIKKGRFMSYEEADRGRENPNYNTYEEFSYNCQTCTVSHMMRRLGFDIEAKGSSSYEELSRKGFYWENRFTNIDGSKPDYDFTDRWKARHKYGVMTDKRVREYFDEKIKDDGIYEIYCCWKSKNAHVFLAERRNGVLKMFDPQTAKQDVIHYIKDMNKSMIGIIRIDNKLVNPKIANIFNEKEAL